MAIYNEAYCRERLGWGGYESLNEAKFAFLPKFKRNPELSKYYNDLIEAEKYLNSKGEFTKSEVNRVGALALRIFTVIYDVCSAAYLPFCLAIIPIPAYLILRCWSWAGRAGEELIIKNYGYKIIEKYNKVMADNQDNEEVVNKCQDAIDKLTKKLNKDYD
jgi:hypothetical protein